MIGLDTNILARFFAQDDPQQSQKADEVIGSFTVDNPGWVSLTSVIELVWVFTSNFRAKRGDICKILEQLVGKQEIVVENFDVLKQSLEMYRRGNADFADCLISAFAHAAGCTQILTFDKDAARTASMTLIP